MKSGIKYKYKEDVMDYDLYKKYIQINIDTNRQKTNTTWIGLEAVDLIADFVIEHKIQINSGICHGVRTGNEVAYFRQRLHADIIGTDLNFEKDTSYCIVWDFHKTKMEWLNSFDFIYSNSLDHTYDPKFCLSQWGKCLKAGGLIAIEWADDHGDIGATIPDLCEPFHATLEIYKNFVKEVAGTIHIRKYIHNNQKRSIILGLK